MVLWGVWHNKKYLHAMKKIALVFLFSTCASFAQLNVTGVYECNLNPASGGNVHKLIPIVI